MVFGKFYYISKLSNKVVPSSAKEAILPVDPFLSMEEVVAICNKHLEEYSYKFDGFRICEGIPSDEKELYTSETIKDLHILLG